MPDYSLRLYTDQNVFLTEITDWSRLTWFLNVNHGGRATVEIPLVSWNRDYFATDRRLEIWRRPDGFGTMVLVETFLLRDYEESYQRAGDERAILYAPQVTEVLSRRIIAYNADSAEAIKGGPAVDVLLEYAEENIGVTAGAGRDITGAFPLAIPAAPGTGANIDHSASRGNLLAVMQEVARKSDEAGTPVRFLVRTVTPGVFELRAVTGQWGTDKTAVTGATGRVFSREAGTLRNANYRRAEGEEFTICYVGGQGQGAARVVRTVQNTAALNRSAINRREGFKSNTQTVTAAVLDSDGYGYLYERRARELFTADLMDAPGSRYQVDWNFGDRVTAGAGGLTFDCEIATVRATATRGQEQIETRLEYIA